MTEVLAGVDALALSTHSATISFDVEVAAATAALTLTEQQADVSLRLVVDAGTDALTLTTYGATIVFDVEVLANTAALVVTGTQSVIDLDIPVTGNEVVFNSWLRGTTSRGVNFNFSSTAGILIGDDGEAYGVVQWGGNTNCCKIVRLWDGEVVASIDGPGVLASDVNSVHGYSHSYSARCSGGAVNNGTHAFALGQATSVGGSLGSAWACAFYKVNSSGNVVADGVYVGFGTSIAGVNMIDPQSVVAAGIKDNNFVAVADEGSGSLQTVALPPPGTDTNEFAGLPSPRPWDSRVLFYDDPAVIEGRIGTFGFGGNGALFWANGELYGYFNKSICNTQNTSGGGPAPIDLEAATYPDGFICRFTTSIAQVNGYNTVEITGYTVINSSVPNFPWSDQSLASDDTTTDYGDDYWRSPGISFLEVGTPVAIFAKTFDDSTDRSPTGTRGRYRAYSITGTSWRELLDTGDDNLYHVVDDLGAAGGGLYNMSYAGETAVWDRVRNNLYLLQQAGSTSPSPATNSYVISKVGDFIVTPASGHVVVNVNIV